MEEEVEAEEKSERVMEEQERGGEGSIDGRKTGLRECWGRRRVGVMM